MGIADIIAIIVIIALLVCAVRYWVLRKKGCGCGGCGGCGSCGGCNGCGVGSGIDGGVDGRDDCEKNGECKRQ